MNASSWVHFYPHILQIQGRCSFVKIPKERQGDEEEEEEEPEEAAETGPKILAEIAEDEPMSRNEPAWTFRLSSSFSPKALVLARSQRWPGAYCVCRDAVFSNIYIGFGVKSYSEPFTPSLPAQVYREYPEIPTEAVDPSVEEEEEWEKINKPPEKEEEEGEDEEGDEEGEDD